MKLHRARRDLRRARQRHFTFVDRTRSRDRWFKRTILAATFVAISVILGVVPRGRYVTASVVSSVTQGFRDLLGIPTPRREIDERWRRFRLQGIADSQRAMPEIYDEAPPNMQRLMRYAGLDPEHGLLRWGNYDRTILLPSKVFEADDTGRSYRLRPCVDAIWLREITIRSGVLMCFLVPDGPGLADAMRGTSAARVEASRQSTNSWGLRGPEPDLEAPVRGIVLGDSFMQGMFIGEDDTPPECLRRELEQRMKSKVSILNTGVLGYSPEQYYFSLLAFADRFRPHFVVVSVFVNDFAGEMSDAALYGKGGWDEGKYWLEQIIHLCQSRGWMYLIVPAPYEPVFLGRVRPGYYPGAISNSLGESSLTFLDPSDGLINAHLELVIAGLRIGKRPYASAVFNMEMNDIHLSAKGAQAWAKTVGHRLALLLEENRGSKTGNN
jgi:hypothetical protein